MNRFYLLMIVMLIMLSSCQHILDPDEELRMPDGYFPFEYLPANPLVLSIIRSSIYSFNKDLKLYSLEKGFDSVQVRIWFRTDSYQDSLYHGLILSKYKEKPWKVIRVDFGYPIVGGEFRMNEPLEFCNKVDLSDKADTTILKAFSYIPFKQGYVEKIEACRAEGFHSSKNIIIEYGADDRYSLLYFSSPISLNDSCRNSVALELEIFLRKLQQSFELEFIDNYFEE